MLLLFLLLRYNPSPPPSSSSSSSLPHLPLLPVEFSWRKPCLVHLSLPFHLLHFNRPSVYSSFLSHLPSLWVANLSVLPLALSPSRVLLLHPSLYSILHRYSSPQQLLPFSRDRFFLYLLTSYCFHHPYMRYTSCSCVPNSSISSSGTLHPSPCKANTDYILPLRPLSHRPLYHESQHQLQTEGRR